MPLTRRSFLRAGTLTAFAAAASLDPVVALASNSRPAPTPKGASGLTRAAFEPYVGGVFRGRNGRRPVSLTLLSVEGYAPDAATRIAQARPRSTDSFTLCFGADRPLAAPSATNTLEHGALGRFDLFMTGSADARGRYVYQAVINNLI